MGFTLFVIFIGCMFAVRQMTKSGKAAGLAGFEQAIAAAGMRCEQGFAHFENKGGIAIDRVGKRILLMSGAISKVYGYGDVRSWELRVAVGNTGLNNRGLHLSFRDLQYPRWRVTMLDGGMRARWMEIMEQEINEGGAAGAGA